MHDVLADALCVWYVTKDFFYLLVPRCVLRGAVNAGESGASHNDGSWSRRAASSRWRFHAFMEEDAGTMFFFTRSASIARRRSGRVGPRTSLFAVYSWRLSLSVQKVLIVKL